MKKLVLLLLSSVILCTTCVGCGKDVEVQTSTSNSTSVEFTGGNSYIDSLTPKEEAVEEIVEDDRVDVLSDDELSKTSDGKIDISKVDNWKEYYTIDNVDTYYTIDDNIEYTLALDGKTLYTIAEADENGYMKLNVDGNNISFFSVDGVNYLYLDKEIPDVIKEGWFKGTLEESTEAIEFVETADEEVISTEEQVEETTEVTIEESTEIITEEKTEDVLVETPVESLNLDEHLLSADSYLPSGLRGDVLKVTYVSQEKLNGVLCDILRLRVSLVNEEEGYWQVYDKQGNLYKFDIADASGVAGKKTYSQEDAYTTLTVFIDRENQNVCRILAPIGKSEMTVDINHINSIKVPVEADGAKEVSNDKIISITKSALNTILKDLNI